MSRGVRRLSLLSLPRPVWIVGWVSFFTDAASEAIYPLLPFFLTRLLHAGALSLGIIEGVAEAANSILKIASGHFSDRWQRRRPIVLGGYTLSSAARPLVAVAWTWPQVLAIRFFDRIGKGVRGAPRDAMLAEWGPRDARGLVFGFHRAMDHAGAVAGPLLATWFLFAYPGHYRTLFALTAIPGALAVLMLLRVPESASMRRSEPAARASALPVDSATVAGWRDLPSDLYRYLGVILVFTLGNSTDAFLLLRLTDARGGPETIPLLWAALHVVKSSFSVAGGALSDRIDRRVVIAAGWTVYAIVYAGFAISESAGVLVFWFLVYGLYFGLTEGVEKAIVADFAPPRLSGTAFGLYNAIVGIGALVASVAFGVLWQWFGAPVAFGSGALIALLAIALLFMLVPARRTSEAA